MHSTTSGVSIDFHRENLKQNQKKRTQKYHPKVKAFISYEFLYSVAKTKSFARCSSRLEFRTVVVVILKSSVCLVFSYFCHTPTHTRTHAKSQTTEEDLKRLQQETSGGNYSQVDFHYDGQTTASSAASAGGATSPTTTESSVPSEESELPYTLPNNLLVAPAPGTQLVSAEVSLHI